MAFWTDVSPNTRDPKRKFRFLLTIPAINQSWAVKTVSKPAWKLGATEHTFINHKFYYPGRLEWDPVNVTLVDPITPYDTSFGVMQWLQTAGYRIPGIGVANTPYSISKSKAVMNNPLHKYASPGGAAGVQSAGDFIIKQIDAEGAPIEEWRLFNAWIQDAKFGDLGYDTDDLIEVALTIRYDFANYKNTFSQQPYANDGLKNDGHVLEDNPRD